jgi:hypothetical protein
MLGMAREKSQLIANQTTHKDPIIVDFSVDDPFSIDSNSGLSG